MKKLSYLFIFILSIGLTKVAAQNPLPAKGSNVLIPSLNKFIGTWQCNTSNETIIFKLKKDNVFFDWGDGFRMDVIIGYYSYKKNNVLI